MQTEPKQYKLEDRTRVFAKTVRDFLKLIPRSQSNLEYSKQLIRSSASIGANFIEAAESLSRKDFLMRVKICRKEAKESIFWLDLIEEGNFLNEKNIIVQENTELMKILGAIVIKTASSL